MNKHRIGDTVYRLLPSGTLFTYTVRKVHKDGEISVMPHDRGLLTRMQRAPAWAFTADPKVEAKPLR